MADIKCPVCGEMNPVTNDICSNCLTQLKQGTDALRDLGKKPIQPGQVPTKKTTSELEPMLPQWLRDARSQSSSAPTNDDSSQNDSAFAQQSSMPSFNPPPGKSVSSGADLLAGLQSQSSADDEEDVPSWLTGVTGIQPKQKSAEPQTGGRRVELGGSTGQLPPLKNQGESAATPRITATQAPSEKRGGTGELPPWLAETMAKDPHAHAQDDTPMWLPPSQGAAEPTPDADPFGFGGTGAGKSDATQLNDPFAQSGGLDWMSNLQSSSSPSSFNETVQDQSPIDGDLPAWLSGSAPAAASEAIDSTQMNASPQSSGFADQPPASDTPDWLNSLDAAPAGSSTFGDQSASTDTPDWLSGLSSDSVPDNSISETPASVSSSAFGGPSESDTPDWLSSLSGDQPRSSAFSEPPVTPPAAPVASAFNEDVLATPDWMNDLGSQPSAPAFASSSENLNSLFTETPDWLSKVEGGDPTTDPLFGKSDKPAAFSGAADDSVSPANLPSWVQAMRPLDNTPLTGARPQSSGGPAESAGPLAGLQGVLPAVPFLPTSKPRAYSIKLQASDEHQAHSALMEHIIEAETTPEPIVSMERVVSQRWLRRSLFAVFALLILGVLYAHTQIFSLPVAVPIEVNSAMAVAENMAENSPVLVIVDYDPALVSEMEAISVPLIDHMILLKHARLTFISTSPLGESLAERLISVPLQARNYQRGTQFVNLGYLPGGPAGVHAFAQDPVAASPQSTDLTFAWSSAALQGVTSLNQFAAIVLITDSADAGRMWIEQTGELRGPTPLLVAASAQAGPMLYPYYRSGQIVGMINGLHGAAVAEQRNAGLPGTARLYWDGYSLSLLLSVVLMTFGGMWNFFAGIRAQRSEAR